MNISYISDYVNALWNDSIISELVDYIRIPSKSPAFDSDWAKHGYMDDAVTHMERWCRDAAISGMTVDIVRLPNRTPLLFIDVPGTGDGCVLLYGHLDKQPEMTGWRDDLGPWIPVIENERLYGRGGADDGYAVYAAMAAIRALHAQQIPHARCVIIIEACEESGSYDLPFYLQVLQERIGTVSLVICLDSGCGNYQQLWVTTSLRGIISGTLRVDVLREGVHSGDASGIVPDSFRILRELLARIEDVGTGRIRIPELYVDIPKTRRMQAIEAATILQTGVYEKFPFVEGAKPSVSDMVELVMNRTWRPGMVITGADGLPDIIDAGNVMRPFTALKLSIRIPPTCDMERAAELVKQRLEADPPLGAQVQFIPEVLSYGWHAPETSKWLDKAVQKASKTYFDRDAVYMGEGGSIPFMQMLGQKYPQAQFLVTGVLGPGSNAHGPNEFLHLPTAKNLTCCLSQIIATHYEHQ